MPEANLRGILAAFAEKNWVVYELTADDSKNLFRGPVDNLQYWVGYRVLPAAEDPSDIKAAEKELNDMSSYSKVSPSFEMPDRRVLVTANFSLTPLRFDVCVAVGLGFTFPIDEVEGLIREYFTTYDREEAQRVMRNIGLGQNGRT